MSNANCTRFISSSAKTIATLLIAGMPLFGQDTKSAGTGAVEQPHSVVALEAQLRAQLIEIELLKNRVQKLEGVVASLETGGRAENAEAPVEPRAVPAYVTTAYRVGAEYHPPEVSRAAAQPSSRLTASSESSSAETASNPELADPAVHKPYEPPRELLPDIGQVGAAFGLLTGGSTNPFKADKGFYTGGFIDLPLTKIPVRGGKLSYEIMVDLQRSTTPNVPVTSGVFALVNNALCGALSGTGPGGVCPLPITINTQERTKILTVVPFSLKYTITRFDARRFRPYFVVGWGTYVTITSQNTSAGIGTNNALLNSLLNGPLIGGLAPEAPELRALGIPNGQGDIRFGINAGAGYEYRIFPRASLGFEYRANAMEGKNGFFSDFAAKTTFHF